MVRTLCDVLVQGHSTVDCGLVLGRDAVTAPSKKLVHGGVVRTARLVIEVKRC